MTRRTVSPYPTRQTIDYAQTMGTPEGGPFLLCLTEQQVEVIRQVLPYARREVNWIVDKSGLPGYYGVPTSTEMEGINDMLDDLDGRLIDMTCVEDMLEVLDAIQTCVCQTAANTSSMLKALPDVSWHVTEGLLTHELDGDTMGSPTEPGTDEAKCEIAQAIYAWNFQIWTETVSPFVMSTVDVLTDLIAQTGTFSWVAGWAGMPIMVLSNLINAIVDWGVSGSIENLTNWYISAKQDLVCAIYDNLPDYDACATACEEVIDDSEMSVLDKLFLKATWTSTWHMTWIAQDQQDNGTYDDYITPGYCEVCETAGENCIPIFPCVTEDWTPAWPVEHDPYVWITGGTQRYDKSTLAIPSDATQVTFYWTPEGNDSTASVVVSLYVVGTGQTYICGTTASKTIGTYTSDTFSVPNMCKGQTCKLVLGQDVWWAQPHYLCFTV